MLEATADFIQELNKKYKAPIYLYTVINYNGLGEDLNYSAWNEDVVFDGVTYEAFPISHDLIGENSDLEIDLVKVTISNISRLMQSYLEDFDWRGKDFRIRMVFKDLLASPDDKIDFIYTIDSYSADQKSVTITLLPRVNVMNVTVPARIYSRNSCQWDFGSEECGYSGEGGPCNKTKASCKALNNYRRFGGFPSIPTQKIYVI
ncbi:MAG TPA: DUF2163 domain-containing protein [Candidatus Omnitrophota bacterium]|nr:DUF2163 domain-containing protein [Candidatus Omnitrophota bacterium]